MSEFETCTFEFSWLKGDPPQVIFRRNIGSDWEILGTRVVQRINATEWDARPLSEHEQEK